MARYKATKTITLTAGSYPDPVKIVNEIAKERNRSVHETAADIFLEAGKNRIAKLKSKCQEFSGVHNG